MGSIEILAVILAVLVLLKLVLWLINPKYLLRVAEAMMKNISLMTVFFVAIIVVVGYYILQRFSIVEIGALLLFSTMLIGVGLLPLYPTILKAMRPLIAKRFAMVQSLWLAFLIWGVIAIMVLYAVLR
ncbi:MAG: hypothetical protein QT02_C0002G0059 [archaeon GW2011_AR9]|nr:MAG: hypothetical protein QT02_C0002G0059 [archaeon GW2011_AR9]MBS3120603.1 hypothetical protein [Candidatus Woesearchaeota archaeon]HIG93017.1 hypothetical protein [Candidatus Woesearchaeota archaeon]HIH12487.1 hypothetical protein [Candidatus Woesearchaeota archaeon]